MFLLMEQLGIIINITGDETLTTHETNEAVTLIMEAADEEAEIIWGSVIDDSMEDILKVTVIATGLGHQEELRQSNAAQVEQSEPQSQDRVQMSALGKINFEEEEPAPVNREVRREVQAESPKETVREVAREVAREVIRREEPAQVEARREPARVAQPTDERRDEERREEFHRRFQQATPEPVEQPQEKSLKALAPEVSRRSCRVY